MGVKFNIDGSDLYKATGTCLTLLELGIAAGLSSPCDITLAQRHSPMTCQDTGILAGLNIEHTQ